MAATLGCGAKPPDQATSKDAHDHSATGAAPAPLAGIVSLPPSTGLPSGWKRTKEPQALGADTLWESIDGAAEAYLAYGFQEGTTTAYTGPAGLEVTLDIYRMADAKGAFGIYAQESSPNAEFFALGDDAYVNRNVANFWSGAHYVKLTALGAGENIGSQLRSLATAVAARLPVGVPPPAELSAFPAEQRVAHSLRYIPKDFLGQGYLANAFDAQYRDDKSASSLAFIGFRDPDEASAALDRYKAFLAASGPVRSVTLPPDGAFVGTARVYGRVLVARSRVHLVFALGGSDETRQASRVAALIGRLNSMTGSPGK